MFRQLLSDFKKHFRQTFIVLLLQVLCTLLLFATNYILIRAIGERDYGNYVTINTWVMLLAVVALFGMDDFLIAVLPKYPLEKTKNVLAWTLRVLFFSLLATALISECLLALHLIPDLIKSYRLLFYGFLFSLTISNYFISYLRASHKIIFSQIIDKIIRPLIVLLIMAFCWKMSHVVSLNEVLLLQISALVIAIFSAIFLLRKVAFNKEQSDIPLNKTLKPNVSFVLISLLYLLRVKLDILFLSDGNVSIEEVGYYNLAARMADLVGYPVGVMNIIIPTYISKQIHVLDKTKIKTLLLKISIIVLCVSAVMILGVVLLGDFVLQLFGKNFGAAFVPTIILSFTYIFAAVSAPLNGVFMVSGRQKFSLISTSVCTFVCFVACWFLIPRYGMIGAALATLTGNIAFFFSILFYFNKFYKEEI